jgi:stress-induced morphogen
MDKNQLLVTISQLYKSLTPSKVSVFKKNDDILNIRVIAEVFKDMTFSSRFRLLNQLLKDQDPKLFKEYIFVFEAFTADEAKELPQDDSTLNEVIQTSFKNSAKEIES